MIYVLLGLGFGIAASLAFSMSPTITRKQRRVTAFAFSTLCATLVFLGAGVVGAIVAAGVALAVHAVLPTLLTRMVFYMDIADIRSLPTCPEPVNPARSI